MPGYRSGRPPRNKGLLKEIVVVMRCAGETALGAVRAASAIAEQLWIQLERLAAPALKKH
jgi:hypothetical protein